MKKTTQDAINNAVWKACDSFRGTLNSSQYKDYILTMLFVKYLSDVYKEKVEELKAKHGDNEDRIKRSLAREKFHLSDDCTFDYLYANRDADDIGDKINKVLEKIEEENKEKLEGVFRNIDFNSETNLGKVENKKTVLKNLLTDFSSEDLDLRPSKLEGNDVMGDAYEYLIGKFASEGGAKGGEFFTPSQVSTILARLVQAKEGDRIYDPTCGSGSLLIKAAKEVGSQNFQIYGQEKNGQTEALAKMNMFLHNVNDAKIERGDTLTNPIHIENNHIMKFDVVVANPPFSLDKWGYEKVEEDVYGRFSYGLPPKSKGDYAFVQHMIASLNENGRMAVVLPHGTLFRGASEEKIRKGIIEDNLIDAVIGLPGNIFYGTSIPTCIVVMKKQKDNTDILFIDASQEYKAGKNKNTLEPENIERIVKAYFDRKDEDKFSHVATIEEIRENGYNLNIPRYVDTFEEEERVDVHQVREEIKNINKELLEVESKIEETLKALGL